MFTLSPLARVGLFKKRECWCLTLRGWLGLIFLTGAVILALFHSVFPFLAQNRPVKSEILVVEGWIPDYSVEDVKTEFESGGYRLLVLTGPAILKGEAFAEFKTFPEFTRAILLKKGWDETKVVAVPCGEAFKNRTYSSAVALKRWLADTQQDVRCINIYSMGAHARRTKMLFEMALQGQIEVGVIAGKDLRFDGKYWWRTSEGLRTIISETIGYLYARFLFSPPEL